MKHVAIEKTRLILRQGVILPCDINMTVTIKVATLGDDWFHMIPLG